MGGNHDIALNDNDCNNTTAKKRCWPNDSKAKFPITNQEPGQNPYENQKFEYQYGAGTYPVTISSGRLVEGISSSDNSSSLCTRKQGTT
eukprot:scaffold213429_cov26-Prasinocladus_malaysianus.AAC.1